MLGQRPGPLGGGLQFEKGPTWRQECQRRTSGFAGSCPGSRGICLPLPSSPWGACLGCSSSVAFRPGDLPICHLSLFPALSAQMAPLLEGSISSIESPFLPIFWLSYSSGEKDLMPTPCSELKPWPKFSSALGPRSESILA